MIHWPVASMTRTAALSSRRMSGGCGPMLLMRLPAMTSASFFCGGAPEPSIKVPLRITRSLVLSPAMPSSRRGCREFSTSERCLVERPIEPGRRTCGMVEGRLQGAAAMALAPAPGRWRAARAAARAGPAEPAHADGDVADLVIIEDLPARRRSRRSPAALEPRDHAGRHVEAARLEHQRHDREPRQKSRPPSPAPPPRGRHAPADRRIRPLAPRAGRQAARNASPPPRRRRPSRGGSRAASLRRSAR